MRALLVVNPKATTTSPRAREVIVHALASAVDLDVAETQPRARGAGGAAPSALASTRCRSGGATANPSLVSLPVGT